MNKINLHKQNRKLVINIDKKLLLKYILDFILNKWGAIDLNIHHSFCNSKEIYYYCKICYEEYILERNGSYPEQYIFFKVKNNLLLVIDEKLLLLNPIIIIII